MRWTTLETTPQVIWRKRMENSQVPKEKDASIISQLRTLSLLCVEGKIFFAVQAKRLRVYMTKYGYIDTSTERGSARISRMP